MKAKRSLEVALSIPVDGRKSRVKVLNKFLTILKESGLTAHEIHFPVLDKHQRIG